MLALKVLLSKAKTGAGLGHREIVEEKSARDYSGNQQADF